MALVRFRVPDEVEDAFNEAFEEEDQSRVVAMLMRQAAERRQKAKRRQAAVQALLKFRAQQEPVSSSEVAAIRRSMRP